MSSPGADTTHPHPSAEPRPLEGPGPDHLDPATRALAEALRLGILILKVAFGLLVVVLLLSGTRSVEEGTVAVRLLFGAIHGAPGEQVLEPGGPYLWPPEPVGRFVSVPTTVQQLVLDGPGAFWFSARPGEELTPLDQLTRTGGLVPGQDGSLLTSDGQIVHARWTVTFQVIKAEVPDFVRRLGGEGGRRELEARARELVRPVAQQAIVHAVASLTADELLQARVDRGAIVRQINEGLRELQLGLLVTQVLLDQSTPPLAVREAFQALSRAEAEKAHALDRARQDATSTLLGAAGDMHGPLMEAVRDYEEVRRTGTQEEISRAERSITALLQEATGEASELLRAATLYRHTVEDTLRAESKEFQQLQPRYAEHPELVLVRRWQDTLQRILAGDVETFYVPGGADQHLYLEIPRDPRVAREREIERRREQAPEGGAQER